MQKMDKKTLFLPLFRLSASQMYNKMTLLQMKNWRIAAKIR